MTLGLCFSPKEFFQLQPLIRRTNEELNFLLFLHWLIEDDYSQIGHIHTLEQDESFELSYLGGYKGWCWSALPSPTKPEQLHSPFIRL